ncbi:hypothetical protein OOK31_08765 [Streptomyces sp. NBC_00249]|uniref:hypothetical protein n=1 Tax=Streptomyces sp. NBC_00249 TaxID=2975690 RepID=UPI00224FA00F|nr:hypothetical protein [Streptomyces sp. NBC_00249]MCX5193988.1 hypothetical protein [Streptomyces sp. NBC_00249]
MRRLLIPLALAAGVLWWWAVLRLALAPGDSGAVEGAVAVGGWGLGLLPVHCTARAPVRRGRVRGGAEPGAAGRDPEVTTASTLHRSGEESAPS